MKIILDSCSLNLTASLSSVHSLYDVSAVLSHCYANTTVLITTPIKMRKLLQTVYTLTAAIYNVYISMKRKTNKYSSSMRDDVQRLSHFYSDIAGSDEQ